MRPINLSQAFDQWQELAADIPKNDYPMLAESWNNYTDSLARDGNLCALQYHYTPAYDEPMPGSGSRFDALADDRAYILDAMGVGMKSKRAESRADAEEWGAGASHWRVTITRAGKRIITAFSMGSAHMGKPALCDVVGCLLRDIEYANDSFSDWCDALGLDSDSRKAERTWRACKRTAAAMARLFSASELAELSELFADY